MPALDAALLERFVAPARAALPRDIWETGLATGHALTQEQAQALAIQPIANSS